MSDLTPPPDEPMPEQSRARIRADLLRTAQSGNGSRAPRWIVPGVAAAAVVLVAGLAAWAVQLGNDGGDTEGAPAGATATSGAPVTEEPSVVPSEQMTQEPSVVPSEQATTKLDGSAPVQAGGGSCEEELVNVLPGAERAVAFPDDRGTTSFWVKGGRFVLCDVRAGTTTVHQALPLSPSVGVETFRVSSSYAPTRDGFQSIRVAGGLVPEGVPAYDVRYTFPNGHTERSTTVTDDQGRTWWRMVYAYQDSGSEMDDPPIEVTLSLSGVQQTYQLDWGVDTCAQANHGC